MVKYTTELVNTTKTKTHQKSLYLTSLIFSIYLLYLSESLIEKTNNTYYQTGPIYSPLELPKERWTSFMWPYAWVVNDICLKRIGKTWYSLAKTENNMRIQKDFPWETIEAKIERCKKFGLLNDGSVGYANIMILN